ERRVTKDDVVRAGDLLEESEHVRRHDLGAVLEVRGRDVLPKRPHRLRRALDEGDARRATRERLDAERARTREEVEHTSVAEYGLQDREERFADAIRRRAGRAIARRVERPALGAPG